MSGQDWQTVSNKKKDVKPIQEQKFDPIIARKNETQSKLEADKIASKQIKYDGPKDPNQDWNYITLTKPKSQSQSQSQSQFQQKAPTPIKENEDDGTIKIKKVSKTMGLNVTNARVAKKWSQIQLAHNAAVDSKTISEIERGGSIYDSNVFNKISKALGVKIERNYDLV
jgi:DNA-binding XRE family transcriptional regulator